MSNVSQEASALAERYGHLDGLSLLKPMIRDVFPGRIALTSSFGAESAVLLHMVAEIAPATPVIFLDTGKLFGETRRYRDALCRRLGLGNVITAGPDPEEEREKDPDGLLFARDADACCGFRKVTPLARAIGPYAAWITGRKRAHGGARANLPVIESAQGRVKINPLANWSPEAVANYMALHALPAHPLVAEGFTSIGCMPCTERAAPGEGLRAGRWRGQAKTECGIHLSLGGG